MTSLKTILGEAAAAGVITPDQADPLEHFLSSRKIGPVGSAPLPVRGDAGLPTAEAPAFETEAPRFIRGFHDVLITIGIVIALAGIWGVGSFYGVLPAIVILAEILVRRQRLALPAVALTIAFVQWIAFVSAAVIDVEIEGLSPVLYALAYVAPFPLLLSAFYWRYRVPLSLALTLMTACGLALACFFYLLTILTGDPEFILHHPVATSIILLVAALGLFSVAMYFDLKDPARQTRNSDVAFWLHLGAAPALLYAMLSFVFIGDLDGFAVFSENAGSAEALKVVAIVTLFMAVGLIIDRRAFVTSGLLSLGYAIYTLFDKANLSLDVYVFVTLLIVGVVVLTIGVGWPWFRRLVVLTLPPSLQAKLPPLR